MKSAVRHMFSKDIKNNLYVLERSRHASNFFGPWKRILEDNDSLESLAMQIDLENA